MARHTLMVAKTIWREAENYGVATSNPLMKLTHFSGVDTTIKLDFLADP